MRQRLHSGQTQSKLLFIWCALLMAAVAAGTLASPWSQAVAQEEDEAGEVDDAAADDEADADADAGGDGAGDAGDGEGEDGDEDDEERQSLLGWATDSLGWGYMLIFLMLSFTLVALFVMNLLEARRENVCPVQLVETFEDHINNQRIQEAYDLAKTDESFLGQVLAAGLPKMRFGFAQASAAMQEVGEEENMKMEHRLSYMALIGTISPMVGLFGTVHGMINSFREIAIGGSTPKPQDLARGISTALMTTLVGLAIAIPAIAAYNILKNRVARLVLEVGILSEGLMGRVPDRAQQQQR